jgi:hypothetical protein
MVYVNKCKQKISIEINTSRYNYVAVFDENIFPTSDKMSDVKMVNV